ncbi:MAG: sigma-54-dependent Fis family transcriptional regulator [Xanthomonadaceae bacterium]|nr:sigma-54-dependent Fis family transcriptional regulator [Xanthomonadaceae bacterium]
MKIWIIDDEEQIQKVLKIKLEKEKFETFSSYNTEEWDASWKKGERASVVICDIRMPGRDGFYILDQIKKSDSKCRVIMITGHGEKQMAIQALRLGASDYLEKPFDLDELVLAVKRCVNEYDLMNRLEARVARLEAKKPSSDIYESKSKSMKEIKRWCEVLKRESGRPGVDEPTVLILGETGTGKEVLAREIHADSGRANKPWIAISCANFSHELLESELFGHEKGAFTGAQTQKIGLFELADGGTLFLDEIGEMAGALQAKLLRVLQEKLLRRVGGSSEIKINVRVIAATHVDLESQVKSKKFREDLYHRLAAVVMKIPALRERDDELVEIIEFVFKRSFEKRGKTFSGFDATSKMDLHSYAWPGNIRELINMAERAALLSEGSGVVESSWLGIPKTRVPKTDVATVSFNQGTFTELRDQVLTQFEMSYLDSVMKASQGNATQAAKLAKMDRSNFSKLIRKYKLA